MSDSEDIFIKTKDPDAVLDYPFDWTNWLEAGDTIQSCEVTADSGLTVDSYTNTTDHVICWLSGGTANEDYYVRCKVTTVDGRTDLRSALIKVEPT